MLHALASHVKEFFHLIYPHNCEGCGTDVLNEDAFLCARCLHELPITGYINSSGNPVEKGFYGRIKIENAASGYYFSDDSLVQHLIYQLKYKGNKNVGAYLGKLIGHQLQRTDRFNTVNVLVPLPLNPKRQSKRGYNQAEVICGGIAEVWHKPIVGGAVTRTIFTETQTNQSRISRWENMEGVFKVTNAAQLQGKHIALIDDVTTTGATLEACGSEILKVAGTKLSIIAVANTV